MTNEKDNKTSVLTRVMHGCMILYVNFLFIIKNYLSRIFSYLSIFVYDTVTNVSPIFIFLSLLVLIICLVFLCISEKLSKKNV